jgi:cell division protein FtsL
VSAGGVKLRSVIAWIMVMLLAASLALAHLLKQRTHTRLSRELVNTGRERDALATEVLLLETETRGLRQYSRLEAVARQRLGLVDPGPPVVIQPDGQVLAEAKDGGAAPIRAARWRGLFR